MDRNLANELKRLRDERQKKFQEQDWEGALEIHDRILELSPSPLRYANRGSILYRLGKMEEAVESYRKALEMDPDLKGARADLERLEAQIQKMQKEPGQEAEIRTAPIPGLFRDDGESRSSASPGTSHEEAESRTSESPESPASPGAFRPKTKKESKPAAASRRETAEPQDDEDLDDARSLRIQELRNQRQKELDKSNWAGALEHHNQILELEPSSFHYAKQGSILYRMGKIKEAIGSYEKALELDPSFERARLDLQRLESQAEEEHLLNAGGSREDLEKQRKIEEIRLQRQEKIQAQDWSGALALHDKLLEIEPTALRYTNRGALLYKMNRQQDAIESYRKALEMDPNLVKAKEDLASLEARAEEESLLVPEGHKTAATMTPEERTARLEELRDERQKHIDAKEWDQALAVHDRILELDPTPLRYVNRGSMYYRMGNLEKAIESYRIALEMDPNMGRAQHDLARLEAELAQKRVQEQTEKARREEEDRARRESEEKAIKEAENQKRREEEERSRQLSDQEKAARIEVLRVRRQELIDAESWEEALKVQDEMIELEPQSALRYANRGSILYRMNRVKEAILSYGKAVELDPNLARAKQDLERIKEIEIDKLRKERQQRIEAEDWEGTLAIHDVILVLEPIALRYANRGSILYRIGRLAEAARSYRRALELDPSLDNAREDLEQIEEEMKSTKEEEAKSQVAVEFEEDEEEIFPAVEVEAGELEAPSDFPVEAEKKEAPRPSPRERYGKGEFAEHQGEITSMVVSPDGKKLVSAAKDKTVKIWDLEKRECLQTLKGHQDWIRTVVLSSEGDKAISASDDWNVKVWDIRSGKCEHTLSGHTMSVISLCVSKNDRFLLSGSRDRTIRIWDLKSGKMLNTLSGHDDWVTALCFSPEGTKAISAGYDRTIRIWNVLGWRCTQTISEHQGWIEKLRMTPDGKHLISLGHDRAIRVWSMPKGECAATLQEHVDQIVDMEMSEDGSLLVSAGKDRNVIVWELPSGKKKAQFSGQTDRLEKVALTPDKNFVAAGGGSKMWLWNTQDKGRPAESWDVSPVSCFAVVPSSGMLISGHRSGTISLWKFEA